jgi:predicted ester cyclase
MTALDNKALASRVYEAINTQDLATLDKLFDPHILRHAMGEVGIESAKAAVTNAFAIFPETRFVVEDLIAEGNKVVLRVTVHGLPTPPGEPLPLIMEIFRIENGRVTEIWGAGTLRQPDA